MSVTINGTTGLVFADGSTQASGGYTGFRNRLINADFRIDQRNNGASGTASAYTADRWIYASTQASKITWQKNAGSVTPPSGFTDYFGCTTTSAFTPGSADVFSFRQIIEGYNVADLAFGTASAKQVTLSFWVRSSLTGTFGGSLENGAETRSCTFSYTISAANTWEYKTVTISGDTAGTWVTNNGSGLHVCFSLGCGSTLQATAGAWNASQKFTVAGETKVAATAGATWYITGVQLEKGSAATPFEVRPYGTEFALCQRYYEVLVGNYASESPYGTGVNPRSYWFFKVTKRASPSVTNSGASASGSTYATSITGVGLFNSISLSTAFGATSNADSEL